MCGRSAAQQTELFPEYNLPGLLDTFLKTTPNASLTTKALGKLAGFQDGLLNAETRVTRKADVTATFTAVAASSPADPSLRAKGIEVRFEYLDEHGDKKPSQVVYLDEDGLPPFPRLSRRARENPELRCEALQDFHPDEFPTCEVVPAVDRATGAEEMLHQKADKASVLVAGWYRKADEASVGVGESGSALMLIPAWRLSFPTQR
jgi:hypothetical protein